MRLDKALLELNLAPTRTKAQELIRGGKVKCNDKIITKTSFEVDLNYKFEITDLSTLKYVSRAGLKLEKAIQQFNINFKDKIIMDIGSSTGGFSDCSLQNGASKVIAVDVGSNLMHKSLRNHPKIELYEQTNIKDLPSDKFKSLDFITIDVSFVSLKKIFKKLSFEQVNADIIALIKPQFECGKQIADKYKGVILDQKIHQDILSSTIDMFNSFGYNLLNLTFSPITGGDGNIEYISHLTKSATTPKTINLKQIISNAFNVLNNQ